MKTAKLTGAQLDYWVAKAEGWEFDPYRPREDMQLRRPFKITDLDGRRFTGVSDGGADRLCVVGRPARADAIFNPSTNWAQAGMIFADENYWCLPTLNIVGGAFHLGRFMARTPADFIYFGDTPLIAAMRAFVAHKFGDDVSDTP